jgi:hypothetical protein
MLHESFHVLRAVTLGKAHVDQTSISYFRQIGTSSNYDPSRDDSSRDWVRRLLRGRFTLDTQAMVDRLSTAAAADCANAKKAAEDVRVTIEQYIREFLFVNFGAVTQLKRMARDKCPNLVKFMQSRPGLFMERKRSALLSRLAEEGASAESLERERAQFAAIENTLSQVAVDAGFSGRPSPTARPIGAEMAERSL